MVSYIKPVLKPVSQCLVFDFYVFVDDNFKHQARKSDLI